MSPGKKRFSVASGLPPSAEEATGVTTPGRQDVSSAAKGPRPAGGRIAFTWRLTPERKRALDLLAIELSEQLGRAKLDRAEMLDALVDLARDNPGVRGALVAWMQAGQTP